MSKMAAKMMSVSVFLVCLVSMTSCDLSGLGSKLVQRLLFKTEEELHRYHNIQKKDPCHGLASPKYQLVKNYEEFQARSYDKTKWVSTTQTGINLDEASSMMFEKLFQYISGENDKHEKIEMTCPVLIRVIPGPGPTCESNFTMSFYVDESKGTPPTPSKKDVVFTEIDQAKVYVRKFGGFAHEKQWVENAEKLAKDLVKNSLTYDKSHFFGVGYDSPFQILDRTNEVWYFAE